ncbi:putative armadillo-like helical protein [Helianthus annuus]|nr:putative armadillo-like helical protein [Helianthus annuus]
MAVGISCAGTGLSEAISLLEPLTSDVTDFVRQGALIAMAMVMIQTSEASDSRVGTFRYIFCLIIQVWVAIFWRHRMGRPVNEPNEHEQVIEQLFVFMFVHYENGYVRVRLKLN